MYPTWSFEDGPSVAARIRTTYAAWLLERLPSPPEYQRSSPLLVDGYRTLTGAMVHAARQHQQAQGRGGAAQKKLDLKRQAKTARVVWELAHRYLVALELRELRERRGATEGDLTALVLQAELNVEARALDVADLPALPRAG